MAQVFKIKNSPVEGKAPTAEQLAKAELAVNLKDRKLYTKDADNAILQLAGPGSLTAADVGALPDDTVYVASVSAGDNVSVVNDSGNVTVSADAGVTSITAGVGIAVDNSSGAVEISSTLNSFTFGGSVDVTQPKPADTRTVIQELYVNTGEGTFHESWVAVTDGVTTETAAHPGDLLVYEDPKFVYVPTGSAPASDSLWVEGDGKLYPADISNKVGIGTTDPKAKLEINEPVDSSTPAKLRITNTGDRSITLGFLNHDPDPVFSVSNGNQTQNYLNIDNT